MVEPVHRILHLSDTHVGSDGRDSRGHPSSWALKRLLDDCVHLPTLDAVIVTGDLTDDGSVGGCETTLDLVSRFAGTRGIPHVYAIGNHDSPSTFVQTFGTGHLASDGSDVGVSLPGVPDRNASVSDKNGLRVITLDTVVPGQPHGYLSDSQLRALPALLETPPGVATVVAFHHPPITSPLAAWTVAFGLQNAAALADVFRKTPATVVLCGHFHMQLQGQLAGVPVWVTPGVSTRMDLTSPPHLMRAVRGASASVVEVGARSGPTFQVIHSTDPAAGTPLFEIDHSEPDN